MWYRDGQMFTESEIRTLNPNTSYPAPFTAPSEYEVVFDTPKPMVDELQVAYQDGTEVDSKGNRVIKWSVRDRFQDAEGKTKLEQETEYFAAKQLATNTAVEMRVQQLINDTCAEAGYDSENSIAKYLVEGNKFYVECKALSLWIGNVWYTTNEIKNAVTSGTRVVPSIEELLNELPKYEVINE